MSQDSAYNLHVSKAEMASLKKLLANPKDSLQRRLALKLSELTSSYNIIAFRNVHVLTNRSKRNGKPKALNQENSGKPYYAICQSGGRVPLWALYNSNRKFIRCYTYRKDIEADHPNRVWSQLSGEWQLNDITDDKPSERREQLKAYLA